MTSGLFLTKSIRVLIVGAPALVLPSRAEGMPMGRVGVVVMSAEVRHLNVPQSAGLEGAMHFLGGSDHIAQMFDGNMRVQSAACRPI